MKHALLPLTSLPAIALIAAIADASVVPPPPLHGYLCDESTLILLDSYGNWNADYEGGAAIAPGGAFAYTANQHLALDGSNDRVVVHDGNLLAKRPASSVSAWFRYSDGGEARQFVLYSERDGCGFNVFWVGIEKRPTEPNGLTFAVFDGPSSPCGTGVWQVLTHPVVPSEDVWHHVAAVLHPGIGMKLYFDGLLVGVRPASVPYSGPGEGLSTIGHAHTTSTDTWFGGYVEDLGLFGDALSDAEVGWLATNSLKDLPPAAFPTFCLGDGSGAPCPCGNESQTSLAAGCDNSTGSPGLLRAYGTARLSHDTLALTGSGLPISWGLYVQGETTDSGGAGTTLYDGIRCVGGPILRLGMKYATSGYSYLPEPGETPLSIKGMIPAPGTVRYYQLMYRDTANYCAPELINFTNGVSVTWGP